jgi:hypothetical protein
MNTKTMPAKKKVAKKKGARPIGRPPMNPSLVKKKVNISLRDAMRTKGDALAYEEGISLSELIENLIRKEHERKTKKG